MSMDTQLNNSAMDGQQDLRPGLKIANNHNHQFIFFEFKTPASNIRWAHAILLHIAAGIMQERKHQQKNNKYGHGQPPNIIINS
jgi:hypothetical protein